nr:uncharacterized protein LOC26530698 isoform X2 [Drosophila virilis]
MFVLNDEALVVVVGSCRFQKGILDPVLIPRCACINSMRPYAKQNIKFGDHKDRIFTSICIDCLETDSYSF